MYHGLKQKHGKIQGVSMLPFGLVAGFAGEKEIRIIELAENGFTFRTAEKIADPELFRVCFYHYPKLEYEQVDLHSYTLECSGKYEFYYEYTLYLDNIGDMLDNMDDFDADETENGKSREYEGCKENREYVEYREQVQAMLLWYDRYIRLKLTGDENELASAMAVYPTNGDAVTAENFEEQKKRWFGCEDQEYCRKETGRERETEEKPQNRAEVMPETGSALEQFEWAVELDTTWLYEEYLATDLKVFIDNYWKRNHLSGHWFSYIWPQRLYIGNAFCHLLFPKGDQLFLLLEKARKDGLQVTLTFSYIREFMLERMKMLLNRLEAWCEKNESILEIQVNDWAMAEMIKEKSLLIPVLGILLNKRRKDPRLHYKLETMTQTGAEAGGKFLEENSLNADFYREYLEKEYGIARFEWESCGYDMAFPVGKNSLHLPFYQTNTSQYCTLYAKCTTGERGKQKLVKQCQGFCKDYAFLYPDHLKMVGRYNSLFAMDSRIFEDDPGSGSGIENEVGMKTGIKEMFQKWKTAGTDRLVVNFL